MKKARDSALKVETPCQVLEQGLSHLIVAEECVYK